LNLLNGFKDTLDILAFRWNMVRSRKTKIITAFAFVVVMMLLYATTAVGETVKLAATNQTTNLSPVVQDYAIQFLRSLANDGALFAVTGLLAALIGSIIFIPLVGYSFSTLIPSGDLVSVRRNDYHKLSDSIILQMLSAISLIQLFSLTTLNGLLSIESDKPGLGIIFGWVVWLLMILLTSTTAWTFEWLGRKYGFKGKAIAIGSLIGTLGIIALIFNDKLLTLFGLSTLYSNTVQNLDSFTFGNWAALVGVMAALFVGTGAFLSYIGSKALNLPEKAKKKVKSRILKRSLVFGKKNNTISQYTFLLNIVLRSINIWKPLLTATGFALTTVLLFQGSLQILFSLVFVIPLIVSMSWGVNTFGILGGGITWLTSLPQGKEKLLKNIAYTQLTLVVVLLSVVTLPLIVLFHIPWSGVASFVIATLVSTAAMTRSSLSKTVFGPERYRVHIKGENILPPAKALSYLARFAFGPGTLGIITFLIGDTWIQLGILAIVTIYQLIRFARLNKKWVERPEIIESVIRSVGY